MGTRTDRWTWTINNPGTFVPRWDPIDMHYMVFQMERGADGTLHWQGYTRFKARKVLSTAKHYLCDAAHLAPSEGTEEHNRTYCTKADTREPGHDPHEFGTYDGTKGAKGKRNDLTPLITAVQAGATERQIAINHPELYIRYAQGIARLTQHHLQARAPVFRNVHTTLLWGPTGTGKTHRVKMTILPENLYTAQTGRDPFSDYAGQSSLLIDEFDYHDWDLKKMNLYLDKWSPTVDSRYTNKLGMWTSVFIIANSDPLDWYPAALPHEKAAFLRRISEPMGRIFLVESQTQEVDLFWWIPPPTPTLIQSVPDPAGAGASTAPAIVRTDSVDLQALLDNQTLSPN